MRCGLEHTDVSYNPVGRGLTRAGPSPPRVSPLSPGGSGRIFDSKKAFSLQERESLRDVVAPCGTMTPDGQVSTPDWCCRYCQRSSSCKAFRFEGPRRTQSWSEFQPLPAAVRSLQASLAATLQGRVFGCSQRNSKSNATETRFGEVYVPDRL